MAKASQKNNQEARVSFYNCPALKLLAWNQGGAKATETNSKRCLGTAPRQWVFSALCPEPILWILITQDSATPSIKDNLTLMSMQTFRTSPAQIFQFDLPEEQQLISDHSHTMGVLKKIQPHRGSLLSRNSLILWLQSTCKPIWTLAHFPYIGK